MTALPIPCPAKDIPETPGLEAFNAAYASAKAARVVYVGIEHKGRHWTVKTDTLTAAPNHQVTAEAAEAVHQAVLQLARAGEVRCHSVGPDYLVLYDIKSEKRARELAAGLHAALYGDVEPLRRAVPGAASTA